MAEKATSTEEPDYAEPSERPAVSRSWCLPRHSSLQHISILDRLILSHPVWLQLAINPAKAMHILQQEQPGAFLVRRSTTIQKKILSVRLFSEDGSCFIEDFAIRENQSTFSLEGSSISFADLFRLIAFYCVSRDVLPSTLRLPFAFQTARSHQEIEAISHLGIEFWNSSKNKRHGWEDSGCGSAAENVKNDIDEVKTRAPGSIAIPQASGDALCFINPLFLEEHADETMLRRAWSRRSMRRLRVSTEKTLTNLSPPPRPPPPVPQPRRNSQANLISAEVTKPIGDMDARPETGKGQGMGNDFDSSSNDSMYDTLKAKVDKPVPPPRLKKQNSMSTKSNNINSEVISPRLSSKAGSCLKSFSALVKSANDYSHYKHPLNTNQEEDSSDEDIMALAEAHLGRTLPRQLSNEPRLFDFDSGAVPSIPELDSSSLSSIEEEEDMIEEEILEATEESENGACRPPRLHRSNAFDFQEKVRSSIRKVSEVLQLLLTPEKRVIRKVCELAQDRHNYFGSLVQDYIVYIQENSDNFHTSTDLLQAVRQFLNQLKNYLLKGNEMDPPIESLIPECDIDTVLEKALHKCLLKPLKRSLEKALCKYRSRDGILQQLRTNMRRAARELPAPLAPGAMPPRLPEPAVLEKIRSTLARLQYMYSPSKKVILLLKACKLIYDSMGNVGHGTRRPFGADDFIPVLVYVLARCDMPFVDLEVEYMMELLEPSLLNGEGGYYLTSVYGAMYLLKNYHREEADKQLRTDARNSLRQWHSRRTVGGKFVPSVEDVQSFIRVVFQDGGCTAKTIVAHPLATAEELCQLCADKFRVSDPDNFHVFLMLNNTYQELAADTHPLKIKAELHNKRQLQPADPFYFIYRRVGLSSDRNSSSTIPTVE
uniref:ras and Rab interactor 2-like n=1 Tax=Myxine glutinosa TaxID=7769 RepID=UPI00358EFFA8